MAKRSQGLFEVESDEDSINTTTTAGSEWNGTGEYAVENILAEEMFDGQMYYLLKWEGYPLYRCTWEAKDNISSGILMQEWNREKLAVRRGEKTAFNVDDFNLAVEKWMEGVEDKKRRRIAKRRRRGEPVQSPEDGEVSESEDELAKPQSPKRPNAKSSPVRRKGIAKTVAKPRKKATAIDEGTSSASENSEDSAAPSKTNASTANRAPPKKTKSTATTAVTKPQNTTRHTPQDQTPSIKSNKQPELERKISDNIQVSKEGEAEHVSDQSAAPSTANAARKSVPSTKAKPAPAKRSSASNVFAGDWAEGKKRRQRPRVSGDTPKNSTDPKFTHLAIQNRYQKYSQNEPAPDPTALTMVDPKTGSVQPPKTATTKTATPKVGPTEIHSAYGRRTPPPVSKPRSPSPILRPVPQQTTFASRVPVPPILDTGMGNSRSPVETPKTAFGISMKHITCKYWQAGMCRNTAEQCPWAHGNTKKMTTCFYWKKDGSCRKSAEECEFAHFDTGVHAGAPGTFRRNSLAPNATAVKASDVGLNTGSSSPGERVFDAPERPPLFESTVTARPEQLTSPEQQVNDSANVTSMTMSEPHESFAVPPNVLSHTNATDPRLVGRLSTMNAVTKSPAKDPRLRPAAIEPIQSHPESPIMDISEHFLHASIEGDLKMAEEGIRKVDFSRLVKTTGRPIEHVYVHMPRERAGELDLLKRHFESLNCKVFYAQSKRSNIDHWKFFRDTFRKVPSLLVCHPSEPFINTLPGLHQFVMENGTLRVFSIGVQHQQCIREQRQPAYEAQRLFPHGGVYFISDDVFAYYPEKATEIIEKFLEEDKLKPQGAQLYKIGARPGIKDWLARLAMKKFEDQGGEGICTDLRWVQCYEALCRLCPVEDEDPDYPDHSVPSETSLLWSVWEDSLPSLKGRWESGDEEGATEYMADHFAGEACSKVWKYRKFLFVYQRPGTEKEVMNSQGVQIAKPEVDPKGWMKRYSHIGVVTPDQALKSMGVRKK